MWYLLLQPSISSEIDSLRKLSHQRSRPGHLVWVISDAIALWQSLRSGHLGLYPAAAATAASAPITHCRNMTTTATSPGNSTSVAAAPALSVNGERLPRVQQQCSYIDGSDDIETGLSMRIQCANSTSNANAVDFRGNQIILCTHCRCLCCLGEATCCSIITGLGCAVFALGIIFLICWLANPLFLQGA